MAKSKPDKRNQKRKKSKPTTPPDLSPAMAQPLLEQATTLLQTGQPDEALLVAKKALRCLSAPEVQPQTQLPVLELIGEIQVELGNIEDARTTFEQAAELDADADLPEEEGGGADKFLWLAQLSEDGGADSVHWFDKGIRVLRREIATEQEAVDEEDALILEEKKAKLANALCGAAEVYMTDLSWNEDAEQRCENLVTEACLVAPDSPEPLQTLASVRISQTRLEDARSALNRSLGMWLSLPPEHPDIPEFPTRISLARLLMEAEMEDKAMDILERLIREDDSSVEAWYLGGWCLNLFAQKRDAGKATTNGTSVDSDEHSGTLTNSRKWLQQSLKLYVMMDYEDNRLREHAEELVAELNGKLGPPKEGEEEDEDDWEDAEDEDRDEEMAEV